MTNVDTLALTYVNECSVSYKDGLELAAFERQHKRDFEAWWRENPKTVKKLTTALKPAFATNRTGKGLHLFTCSCTDHLGNVFRSKKDMCAHYHITDALLSNRLNWGWDLKDALTTPAKIVKREVCDHLGNHFESVALMCKFWKVKSSTFDNRVKRGMSVEDALTIKRASKVNKGKGYVDHQGNHFESLQEMCDFWHITIAQYYHRKGKNMSLKDLLTKPALERVTNTYHVKDHLGKEFSSIREMCKHWHIKYETYSTRKQLGWNLEKRLTQPIVPIYKKNCVACTDHRGRHFDSVSSMCKAWDIAPRLYRYRVQNGWSVKDALTMPARAYEQKVAV